MQQSFEPQADAPLIMVVEDEVLVRLVAADMLQDAGYRVAEACSADEAIALLAAGMRFDVIFTDVNMPGSLDGLGLVAYMKERYPFLPVILTSGRFEAHVLQQARPADALAKPYKGADLTRVVGQVLAARHG